MQRFLVVAAIAGAALATGASAQQDARWLFGLETRVGRSDPGLARDYELGVIPSFSYFVSERIRVDGFLGFIYSDSDNYSLWLMPGVRYYHRTAPERLRFNSGLAAGFKLFEEDGPAVVGAPGWREDVATVRLVPMELEYWHSGRGALTLGLDYQVRVLDGGATDDEGFGLTAGFRVRLK